MATTSHYSDRHTLSLRVARPICEPLFADEPAGLQEIKRAVAQTPSLARRFVEMHRAYRHQLDRLQSLDDAIGGQRTDAMRLPWDEVRDYFHDCDHYIGSLEDRKSVV